MQTYILKDVLWLKEGTKVHMLYDPQHEKIYIIRYFIFEEEKMWDWCSIGNNKHTVTEFTPLEEEEHATDLESTPTMTPTCPHMSSPMTPKCVMNSLE